MLVVFACCSFDALFSTELRVLKAVDWNVKLEDKDAAIWIYARELSNNMPTYYNKKPDNMIKSWQAMVFF